MLGGGDQGALPGGDEGDPQERVKASLHLHNKYSPEN